VRQAAETGRDAVQCHNSVISLTKKEDIAIAEFAPVEKPGNNACDVPPRSRRRVARVLKRAALVLGALCVLFLGGFAVFATHIGNLKAPVDPGAADAIIVLTGGQSRIDAALELLKSGKGERLLISGVHPSATREAVRSATGADKALFSCCVDIDRAARDTIGNAEQSAKWIDEHAYGKVILVTNNYHMPRSLLEMRRLMGSAELEPYPVVNSRLDNGGWLAKPDALRVLFTEYVKFLAAWGRGALPRSEPPGRTVWAGKSASANH
jgi:uncharacterized SAM-binding protein YcdF (DUF218 family)